MGRIPEGTIQDIRNRVDTVGLIGRYVELKRAGRNWKGLCPFHGEKTPSFNVNPDRQIFHCFGCHEGGDVIGFLMKHDGLSFPEAVRNLASECGIEIEESAGDRRERGVSERIFEANGHAQQLYLESLAGEEGQMARDYLKGRGFDGPAIERFGIGYAPDSWDAVARLLEKKEIPAQIGEQAGLLAKRDRQPGYYDRLRGRVTFPIHDVRGRVVGFGGRALAEGQEPKYLNTPETAVFRKRETFYGFPDALAELRSAGRAIVCEGYFDRIALARADLGEALATCGTALTAEHAQQLERRTKEVVLLFDGDSAGRQAMERSLEVLLPPGLRVRAAALPTGEDPDSFLERHGPDALRELVDKSRDALEQVMQWAVDTGCATPAQKADVVNRIVPILALVSDPVERVEFARRLANYTATDEPAVQASVRAAARGGSAPVVETSQVSPRKASREESHLHEFAVLLFRHPGLAVDYNRPALESLLPEGSWKAVIGSLLDAASTKTLDASGAADLFALEERLDEDSRSRLRAVAVDDELFRGEIPPDRAAREIVQSLEKRRVDALQKELTRRMGDPEADQDAILNEKKKLKKEGLSLLRVDAGSSGHSLVEGPDGGIAE
jgi:DNA primase